MYQDQELGETNAGHPFKTFARDLERIQVDFPKQPKRTGLPFQVKSDEFCMANPPNPHAS